MTCRQGVGEIVPIQDARRVIIRHGLDGIGFRVMKHASLRFVSPDDFESASKNLDNQQVVNYLEKVTDLVKCELCAMKIYWFASTGGRVFRPNESAVPMAVQGKLYTITSSSTAARSIGCAVSNSTTYH